MPNTKQNSTRRIHKVTIKRTADDSPDTSWLGKYSNESASDYSIDRKHSLDCLVNAGLTEDTLLWYTSGNEQILQRLLWSAGGDIRDNRGCTCGESGDVGRNEYRYFNPNWENYKGLEDSEIRKYCQQDYKRMESLNRGNWCFIGVSADAEIVLGDTCQTITSGGLWGIESDSGADYFAEVEQEQLAELRGQLHVIGFSKRAIASAFKNVERGK